MKNIYSPFQPGAAGVSRRFNALGLYYLYLTIHPYKAIAVQYATVIAPNAAACEGDKAAGARPILRRRFIR